MLFTSDCRIALYSWVGLTIAFAAVPSSAESYSRVKAMARLPLRGCEVGERQSEVKRGKVRHQ
eukprot:4579987-Pleurochrysis_carterae.AAC.1